MAPVAKPSVQSPLALLAAAEDALERRDLDAALEGFWSAEVLGAEADRCAAGRWMAWMLRGEFSSAWHECDEIRRRGVPDPNRLWQGEDLRGKHVLVRCLRGYGDSVQFLRYAPALSGVAHRAVYEVPPQMLELAPCFCGVSRVLARGEPAPSSDVQVEVMELPYLFHTELCDLPIATSYLQLPHSKIGATVESMGKRNKPRVGLVWDAGGRNPSRSVPAELLAPVLQVEGCEFWNLQSSAAENRTGLLLNRQLCDVPDCRNGILSLAAVISQLDLVITVDTLAAHLAGALGVPAWVMLQYAADWRWMTQRIDSPWYPSLQLFRQSRPEDWDSVMDEVRLALHRFLFERANSLYRYAS